MRFDAIIFDWDGTVCRTLGLWAAGYRHAMASRGHEISEAEVSRTFLHGHDGVSEAYPDLDYDPLMDEVYTYVTTNLHQAALYANATETLQQLGALGVKVSLVSTSSRRVLAAGIRRHGLGGHFLSVISGDDVSRIKPDPEPFHASLQHLDVKAQNTLVIGDNRTDIEAGRAAGTQTCLFTPDENRLFHDFTHLRQSQPDYEINDLAQLLTLRRNV